jgi:hypothetical protein
MSTLQIVKSGTEKGLASIWKLSLIIVPIHLGMSILRHTILMEWLDSLLKPIMGIFGLPSEAAIVLVLGFTTGLYGAIGAAVSLTLNSIQMFTIALMLSFAHNLFTETAVIRRLGVNPLSILILRLGLSLLSGLVMNLLF